MHLLLIEKLTKSVDLTKETEAIEACAFIINNHRSSIEKLLSSNYASHKRSVLRLLTAIVYLAPHLGRELLTTLNLVFNADSLQRFTAHEKAECNLPDEDRVRTCYIYFIMAYIIEGNSTLIKNLLDRNELVLAVVSGLVYDSVKTVCLVLNSLLKYVLKSESVSKTKKIQVFNLNVVKELLRLFEWKGPDYFKALFNRKLKDKAEQYIKMEDLSTITDTTYEFLKELLVSRKHGIAFKCLGQRRMKFNAVQKKILPSIDNFWEHEQKGNLVIEILKACPELAKHFIQKHAPRLDTFRKQNNWHQVIDFFTRLIDQMSPDIIQYHVDKMSAKETIDLIKEVCMAPEILQQLRSKHSLKNQNLDIRHKSAKLLYIMFKQCDNYLFNLSKWNIYRSNDLKKIKFEIINHILLMCPSVESILLSLHMSQVDETINSTELFKHLECILDLLLIITKSIPSFIDTTSSVINYIKILGPIYELNREQENSTRIEFKAVKLLLALEPQALIPNTAMFEQIIQSFFNVYCLGSESEKYEAKILLRRMFSNTGMFENGPLEVDLWLTALNQLDEDLLSDVKSFLVKCIKNYDSTENRSKVLNKDKTSTATHLGVEKNINEIFDNIEKGRTIKGVLDVPTLGKFFQFVIEEYQRNISKGNNDDDGEEEGANEGILKYIENVAFYLFHYLPAPDPVFHSLTGVSHKFSKYMKNWVQKSKPAKLPADFEPKIFASFYNSLVDNHSQAFVDIFKDFAIAVDQSEEIQNDLSSTIVNINGTQYKLTGCLANETDIMNFIYTMVFFVNQLHKNDIFDSKLCKAIVSYLKEFLNILNVITSRNSDISKSGFVLSDNDSESSKALKYLFTNCFYLLNTFDIWSNSNQVTILMYELFRHVQDVDYLDELSVHYRKKICNQIELAAEQTAQKDKLPTETCDYLSDILTVFRLDCENCCDILKCLAKLNFKYFVTPENDRSVFANILAYALERLAELKVEPLENSVFQQITKNYVDLVRLTSVEINYEVIENALFTYLSVFFQNFADINDELFAAIFEAKKLTKPGIKLASLLLDRKQNFIAIFKELLPGHLTKKELIYPLINVIADTNCVLDESTLFAVYNEFKNGIMKSIEKPHKAAVIYKENVISSVFLIEHCMSLEECIEFLNKTLKYESTDVFQLQLIKSIHLKVLMRSKQPDIVKRAYVNFLKTFIQLFAFLLKKENLEYDKINSFAVIAYQWIKLKENLFSDSFCTNISYDSIHSSANWLQFGKACLRHGLKLSIGGESSKKINDESAILLKLLAFLCNDFYVDNKMQDDAKTFFEMTITHPKFFDIATLQQKSAIKTNLMYLINILVKKNHSAIDAEHIPVLLSAYQAKLSHCDQYILATLQLYEAHGVNFHKYRPLFWGESALSHYSLSLSAITKTTLLQEPPMMQLMTLIDRDLCENTLVNFPIWRQLNVIDQTPDVEFKWDGVIGDEQTNNVTMTRNNIEWLIEHNITKVDTDLLLAASRRDETYEDVYDPAFLIPLMQMAFAPETVTKPVRPAQNGLLAVTFAALSSSDKRMRLGAALALQRYRTHLESGKFVDSKLWFHMFDSVQNGLSTLTTEMRKTKKSRIPRVPYVAGLFFARTINILVNPLSEMYRPLSTFLLIKNSFNFLTVPEFNVLFHSPDVNQNIHRGFILDILREGTKCSSDFTILLTGNIFKAILGFFGCPMSNREKNLQILNIINSAVKIPKSAKLMIELIGIIPWLNFVTDNTEFFQFDVLDILCVIVSNLYYSVQINSFDYTPVNRNDIQLRLLLLLLKLCPKLSSRISEIPFMRYLNILLKLSTTENRSEFLTESNLDHLIKCSTGYVDEQSVRDLHFVKANCHVNQYCERKYTFVQRLRSSELDEQKVFILATLREIIINWSRSKRKNIENL